jgi:hypothetical protein
MDRYAVRRARLPRVEHIVVRCREGRIAGDIVEGGVAPIVGRVAGVFQRTDVPNPSVPAATPTNEGGLPRVPGAPEALSSQPDIAEFVRGWAHALVVNQGRSDMNGFYVANPHFRSGGRNATPSTVGRYWMSFFATGATWNVDIDRSTSLVDNSDDPVVTTSCGSIDEAEGPTYLVRLHATEVVPQRDPSIGCPRLEGVYLLRLRRMSGSLRICYETWSLREGVCASCPTARACAALER